MGLSLERQRLPALVTVCEKEIAEIKKRVQAGQEPYDNWETGTGRPKFPIEIQDR